MRVGSLFSGIGGLDLGLERAGMEIVWQVEVDEWCRRVLERHWPDVARFRDVRDCHGAGVCSVANTYSARVAKFGRPKGNGQGTGQSGSSGCETCLPPVDLICGGFPCQPVSHAGRRAGESDSRWLWPEFYRIVCEAQPRWVLVENVPGLRSIDDGRLFGGILRDLAEAGYDAVWFDLSAADVGAPHLRERVFIVAHAECDLLRNEHRRRGGSRGQGAAIVGDDGAAGVMAHAENDGQPRSGGTRPERAGLEDGSEMADAPDGGDERSGSRGDERRLQEAIQRSGGHPHDWSTECRLGIPSHGLPDGLVCGGWECGVPRVIKGQKDRVNRLRGLGNAVVPAVAQQVGEWILGR